MSKDIISTSHKAILVEKSLRKNFLKKGIIIATISGISYGLYSAFVTIAMNKGVWKMWYGNDNYNTFISICILGAIASAFNDTISFLWAFIFAFKNGKIGDFFRCIFSKPGGIMIISSILGGPIASTAYIIAIQMSGSVIIPITALCPAIGTIFARLIFKQKLSFRVIFGILICFSSSAFIGSTSISYGQINKTMFLGMLIALFVALVWGLEGVIGGYGACLIDVEISIMIRQSVSVIFNFCILLPLLSIIAGDRNLAYMLINKAFFDTESIIFFIFSGFFTLFAFSLWYKGNCMCGIALGMACNSAYSFWGPFFCYVFIGLIMGQDGWLLSMRMWFCAILMIFGIIIIAVNPIKIINGEGV